MGIVTSLHVSLSFSSVKILHKPIPIKRYKGWLDNRDARENNNGCEHFGIQNCPHNARIGSVFSRAQLLKHDHARTKSENDSSTL